MRSLKTFTASKNIVKFTLKLRLHKECKAITVDDPECKVIWSRKAVLDNAYSQTRL